jgi:hypothetical protein
MIQGRPRDFEVALRLDRKCLRVVLRAAGPTEHRPAFPLWPAMQRAPNPFSGVVSKR